MKNLVELSREELSQVEGGGLFRRLLKQLLIDIVSDSEFQDGVEQGLSRAGRNFF